jgi:hypothetical protein
LSQPATPDTCISKNQLSYFCIPNYPMLMMTLQSLFNFLWVTARRYGGYVGSATPCVVVRRAVVGDPHLPFYFVTNPPFLTALSGAQVASFNALDAAVGDPHRPFYFVTNPPFLGSMPP